MVNSDAFNLVRPALHCSATSYITARRRSKAMNQKVRIENNIAHGADLQSEPQFGSLGKLIFDSGDRFSDRICQVSVETGNEETYASVRSRAIRVALRMRELGIKRGDIINICAFNTLNTQIPAFAGLFLGATICSIDPTMSPDDAVHLLGLVHPKLIFVCPDGDKLISHAKPALDGFTYRVVNLDTSDFEQFQSLNDSDAEKTFVPVEVDPRREAAFIVFSSGTTGLPKGIKLSHYGLQFGNIGTIENGVNYESILHASSLYWVSALMHLTAKFMVGGMTVLWRHFRTDKLLQVLQDFKVTFAFLSSNHAYDIINIANPVRYDLSKLHCLIFGGASLPEVLLQKVRQMLPKSYTVSCYGMTELAACAALFEFNGEDDRLIKECTKSAGKPLKGMKIKIVDEDENKLGPNEEGQILILTPSIMIGYHNIDSSNEFDRDGYIKTGDIGYFDENGCVYIIDRMKEMFKYNGWHIVPASIEAILRDHPAIAECVIFGKPDGKDGDLPTAAVVRKPGYSTSKKELEQDIVKFVEGRVSDSQRLRGGVHFLDEIPRTPTGKVIRRKIRNMFST